jgi:hypothetical protein
MVDGRWRAYAHLVHPALGKHDVIVGRVDEQVPVARADAAVTFSISSASPTARS